MFSHAVFDYDHCVRIAALKSHRVNVCWIATTMTDVFCEGSDQTRCCFRCLLAECGCSCWNHGNNSFGGDGVIEEQSAYLLCFSTSAKKTSLSYQILCCKHSQRLRPLSPSLFLLITCVMRVRSYEHGIHTSTYQSRIESSMSNPID